MEVPISAKTTAQQRKGPSCWGVCCSLPGVGFAIVCTGDLCCMLLLASLFLSDSAQIYGCENLFFLLRVVRIERLLSFSHRGTSKVLPTLDSKRDTMR